MNDSGKKPLPREVFEEEQTLVRELSPEDTRLTVEELRQLLGTLPLDNLSDYGELHTIGLGGIGAVFSAHEPGLNREVALKILRPGVRNQARRIEELIREARATAQIDHPGIVPVYRFGVFGDAGVYFSMKRVEGETLRTILRKLHENEDGYRRRYTLRRLVEIFLAVCNGVACAHNHGIVHCDLKPANLMVGEYGEVMVMDWGMADYKPERDRYAGAKMDIEPGEGIAPLSGEPRHLGGTPSFMAPEHLTGEVTEPGELSDIYALGCILYSILCWSSSPFAGNLTQEELVRAVATGDYPLPRRVAPREQPAPRELEAICLKAMNRDRTKRYADVDELITELRNYLDGFPVKAYSPTLWYRALKLLRRRPLVPSVLLAAAVTWGCFMSYNYIAATAEVSSLRNLAEYNYIQGRDYLRIARSNYRKYAELLLSSDEDPPMNFTGDLARQLAEMRFGFRAALEFISRLPESQRQSTSINLMVRDIFKSSFRLMMEVREVELLKQELQQARGRWRELYDYALKTDPELQRMNRELTIGIGELKISGGGAVWPLTIRDSEGIEVITPAAGENGRNLKLRSGFYWLDFTAPDGKNYTVPAEISPGLTSELYFSPPRIDPELDLVYVPGGEFRLMRSGRNDSIGRRRLPGYLISRGEVNFRHYLQFWKSLTSPEERNRYRAYVTAFPGGEQRRSLWDDDGNLVPPYTLDTPVVGISGEAAEAYCRWLGRKHGITVRLPSRLEWEKALRGVDGRPYSWGFDYRPDQALLADSADKSHYPVGAPTGSWPHDRSVYGVMDLCGNVRELLRPAEGDKLYQVAGGSWMTSPRLASGGGFQYTRRGGEDIGFRYVVAVPEEEVVKKE